MWNHLFQVLLAAFKTHLLRNSSNQLTFREHCSWQQHEPKENGIKARSNQKPNIHLSSIPPKLRRKTKLVLELETSAGTDHPRARAPSICNSIRMNCEHLLPAYSNVPKPAQYGLGASSFPQWGTLWHSKREVCHHCQYLDRFKTQFHIAFPCSTLILKYKAWMLLARTALRKWKGCRLLALICCCSYSPEWNRIPQPEGLIILLP